MDLRSIGVLAYEMVVLQGEILLGDLLEADDEGARGGIGPCSCGDEGRADGLVLLVVEDAAEVGVGGRALDGDGVASLDEGADDGWREGSVLEGLLLRAEEDGKVGHDEGDGSAGSEREPHAARLETGDAIACTAEGRLWMMLPNSQKCDGRRGRNLRPGCCTAGYLSAETRSQKDGGWYQPGLSVGVRGCVPWEIRNQKEVLR